MLVSEKSLYVSMLSPRQHKAARQANAFPIKNALLADTVKFSGQYKNKPFPKNGVGSINIFQGGIPDCQTLSTLYALSRNAAGADLLQNSIIILPDGTYQVVFPGHPTIKIPVSAEELQQRPKTDGRKRSLVSGNLGIRIIERAFAKLNKIIYPKRYADVSLQDIMQIFLHPKYHYNPAQSMKDLTGWKVKQLVAGKSFKTSRSFRQEAKEKPDLIKTVSKLLDTLATAPQKYIAVVGTIPGKKEFLDPGCLLIAFHDYAVESIHPEQKTITLHDPYNTRIGLTLSYEDFFRYFYVISYAQAPGNSPAQ